MPYRIYLNINNRETVDYGLTQEQVDIINGMVYKDPSNTMEEIQAKLAEFIPEVASIFIINSFYIV